MDKRSEANRQTRVSIARALLHLLGSKEFSDITVTDIVEEAHVARASYYRNFSSKEDLLVNAGRLIMDDFGKAIGEIEGGCLSSGVCRVCGERPNSSRHASLRGVFLHRRSFQRLRSMA